LPPQSGSLLNPILDQHLQQQQQGQQGPSHHFGPSALQHSAMSGALSSNRSSFMELGGLQHHPGSSDFLGQHDQQQLMPPLQQQQHQQQQLMPQQQQLMSAQQQQLMPQQQQQQMAQQQQQQQLEVPGVGLPSALHSSLPASFFCPLSRQVREAAGQELGLGVHGLAHSFMHHDAPSAGHLCAGLHGRPCHPIQPAIPDTAPHPSRPGHDGPRGRV
jgi:hypothetical protein